MDEAIDRHRLTDYTTLTTSASGQWDRERHRRADNGLAGHGGRRRPGTKPSVCRWRRRLKLGVESRRVESRRVESRLRGCRSDKGTLRWRISGHLRSDATAAPSFNQLPSPAAIVPRRVVVACHCRARVLIEACACAHRSLRVRCCPVVVVAGRAMARLCTRTRAIHAHMWTCSLLRGYIICVH